MEIRAKVSETEVKFERAGGVKKPSTFCGNFNQAVNCLLQVRRDVSHHTKHLNRSEGFTGRVALLAALIVQCENFLPCAYLALTSKYRWVAPLQL
jgi:hypothetical protein